MDDPTRRCENDAGIGARLSGALDPKRGPLFDVEAVIGKRPSPKPLQPFVLSTLAQYSGLLARAFLHLLGECLDLIVCDLDFAFQCHK
jgi:hypothetical protein